MQATSMITIKSCSTTCMHPKLKQYTSVKFSSPTCIPKLILSLLSPFPYSLLPTCTCVSSPNAIPSQCHTWVLLHTHTDHHWDAGICITTSQHTCMALTPVLFTHPTSLSDMGSYLFSPLAIHHNSCTSFNRIHQSYNPLSYQTVATSMLNRPNHSRSPSLSKCPVSPPFKEHPDTTSNKCTRSFCADVQQPSQSTAYQPRETYPQSPTVLPVCAVCLRRHKHSMPVIFCAAKHTWDD